ncbi:CoA pyrophosphatase [Lentilitoribacter sp. Alg239-R112]|uniref:CoA pyrophosphatase n=1 Tax=Lentilitoribacter sp. Alg239-R112 TaxID=2305987 RepID=UPI0013A6FDFE|nr:CoA pyrophosphatase [Lentilitoribacter sp. Alg239-R112]
MTDNVGFNFSSREFAQLAKQDLLDLQSHDQDQLAMAYGDHRLNPDLVHEFKLSDARAAAVLIAVTEDGSDVILTKRTEALRKHSGQVAFAGGGIDETDVSAEAAAMREAHEEIGLEEHYIETVGRLPIYHTLTGFSVTPILAVVKDGYSLQANPHEVSEIFSVKLSELMNPQNHVQDSLIWQEKTRYYYTIKHDTHRIWGVTAGIIRTLYERLYV